MYPMMEFCLTCPAVVRSRVMAFIFALGKCLLSQCFDVRLCEHPVSFKIWDCTFLVELGVEMMVLRWGKKFPGVEFLLHMTCCGRAK